MNPSDEQIKAWLASYSGVDGGDPHAPVWVCGIEHGGECEPLADPLVPEMCPGAWTDDYKRSHPDYPKWQYNQKVAKLLVAVRALHEHGHVDPHIAGWREYIRDDLYAVRDDIRIPSFKLNLFPLSSRSVEDRDWADAYGAHASLRDKAAYRELCRKGGRFEFLRAQRARFRPKVVIGTGITFSDDFALAFGFNGSREEFEIRDGRQNQRRCHRHADATGVLIVTPFFGGRHGVNSNGLLVDLAQHVANVL